MAIVNGITEEIEINPVFESGKIAAYPLCNNQECCKNVEKGNKGEILGYVKQESDFKCLACGKKTSYFAFHARHI